MQQETVTVVTMDPHLLRSPSFLPVTFNSSPRRLQDSKIAAINLGHCHCVADF